MGQFSLRRLLASTAIIAIGCADYASARLIALNNRELNNNLQIGVCIAGVLVATVGIGNLFRRPVVALLIGLVASPLLAAIIVALRFKSF